MKETLENPSNPMKLDAVRFFGMDVHLPVFLFTSGLTILFSSLVLIFPEASTQFLSDSRNFVVSRFDTLFTVSMSAFVFIILFLIISPFGKIRLGGEGSKPEFGFFSWVCMLFAAGVGIGIIFGNYLSGAMRNPSAAQKQFPNLLLGFALAEATGLFGLVVALIILFAF
jgi:BCCT family betaine/carnitine transporter